VRNWTWKHLAWVKALRFEQAPQEAAFLDYLHEVEHSAERVKRTLSILTQQVMPAFK